jgi:hypothetical protein
MTFLQLVLGVTLRNEMRSDNVTEGFETETAVETLGKRKGKAIPVTSHQDSNIFWAISSEMAVKVTALHTGHPLPSHEHSWYLFLTEAELTQGPQ